MLTEVNSIIDFVDRLVAKFRPERVILFGSHAYGDPTPDSDVDVLVVTAYRGPSQDLATKMRLATPCAFPLDLLVRSPTEIRDRIAGNDFFLQEIVEKGLILHAADHARVGEQGRRRLRRHRLAATLAKS